MNFNSLSTTQKKVVIAVKSHAQTVKTLVTCVANVVKMFVHNKKDGRTMKSKTIKLYCDRCILYSKSTVDNPKEMV